MKGAFTLFSILLVACLLMLGCGPVNKSESQSVEVDTEDAALVLILKNELNDSDIWYEELGETSINILIADANQVLSILNKLSGELLPPGRHGAASKRTIFDIMYQFELNEISYDLVDFSGKKWIVWEEEKSELAKKLIADIYENLAIRQHYEEDYQFDFSKEQEEWNKMQQLGVH